MKWIPIVVAAVLVTGCNADFDWVKYEPQRPAFNVREACADFTSKLVILDRMGQRTDTFVQREPVRIELWVTNNAEVEHRIWTPSLTAQVWFAVVDGAGRIVTPVCRNCGAFQEPGPHDYGANETQVHAFDWDQVMDNGKQAPVGDYRVHADDLTECRDTLSKSATLRIR